MRLRRNFYDLRCPPLKTCFTKEDKLGTRSDGVFGLNFSAGSNELKHEHTKANTPIGHNNFQTFLFFRKAVNAWNYIFTKLRNDDATNCILRL